MTTYTKWPSPHGHAIASSVTDKLIIEHGKPNTLQDFIEARLLAEAVKVINVLNEALNSAYQDNINSLIQSPTHGLIIKAKDAYRDFLAKIER